MPTPIIVLFCTLFAMAIVWFPTVIWVFRRLRKQHPARYEQLGSPSLIWNNSMRNQWHFFKFAFSGQHRELEDPALTRAVLFMRVWFIIYVALFLTLVVSMPYLAPARPAIP
jgi:hypothetical protein